MRPALAARTAWSVAAALVAVACAFTLAFAVGTLACRPLDGSEGNFLFDAARLRAGLPLYVAPRAGAWDYGSVPSRYYVLYAPLWATVLSAWPQALAATAARVLSLGAWLGLLAGLVAGAPKARRPATLAGAAFVASLYPLTLFAASGRPDAIAVALAGLALVRSSRRGRVGGFEAALFVVAAFFKPNVFAAGLGAIAAEVFERRGRAWPALAAAGSCVLVVGGTLQVLTGGAWMEHLTRTSWMPLSASLWGEQMLARAPFFAAPLALCAWSAARSGARIGLWALAASVAWTLWSLAKIGSASNYWMEPCIVGVVILAAAPFPAWPSAAWPRAAVGVLAVVQVCWTGLAAARSSVEALAAAPRKAAALANARRTCGAGPRDLVMADEAGLEVMLDGRLLEQPLVFTQLVRRGRYPLATWVADIERPDVRCLVLQTDWLERPPSQDLDEAHDLFPAALRDPLRGKFALAAATDGLWIYRSR